MVFSPDGRILAIADGENTVWLWNLTNPVHPTRLGQLLTGATDGVFSVFSPDGRTWPSAARTRSGCGT